jgi:hypothetical protein
MTEEEAGHVICLHTHKHTSRTRILAQAKFLKRRAAADLLPYSRWEASSAKRPFEQRPSLPGCESSNWRAKSRAVYSAHLPFRAMYGNKKLLATRKNTKTNAGTRSNDYTLHAVMPQLSYLSTVWV